MRKKRMLEILIIILVIYITIVAFFYFSQKSIIYHPTHDIIGTPTNIKLDYEEVYFFTKDKIKLWGWYIPNKNSKRVVLFCHGNAGNISYRLDTIYILYTLGLNVFIFDYRGFGKSQGIPSEQGTYLDVEAAWDYLINEKKYSPKDIIVHGRSLGGPIASYIASKKNPLGLIIESTFTSIPDLGAAIYPYLPVKFLCAIKYPTKQYIKNIYCPKLFIHSKNDEIIPYYFGEKLFKIAPPPKYFLPIKGTHGNGFIYSKKIYVPELKKFIMSLK